MIGLERFSLYQNEDEAAERLYFKPSGEEMNYIAGQIASERTEIQDWYNRLKNILESIM